ncbi:MAG: hypothetical protein GY750_14930 [Lentisphaerae bacterium]|nr:hypothetical protein [Lentisphaerota bacterium]MCP4102695.1 hypothetical protein [Lentisphaerota bacterium]
MTQESFKCKNCGLTVKHEKRQNIVECPKCGWSSQSKEKKIMRKYQSNIHGAFLVDPRSEMHFSRTRDLSFLLVVLPVMTTLMIWFTLPLLPEPSISLLMVGVYAGINLFGTAIAAAVEVNMARSLHPNISGSLPLAWLLGFILLWPVTFPIYMFHRRKYLHKNMVAGGTLISLALTATVIFFLLEKAF